VTAATLGALAVAAACAGPPPGGDRTPGDARPASYGPVTVVAENRGTYDAVVYAVRGTFRQRVGNVPSLSTVQLQVPASFTREPAPFALLVTRIAGPDRYTTDAFVGRPELQVRLTLAPRLGASSYALQ
jgi:hypothetical protein